MTRLAVFLAVVLVLTGCSKVVTGTPAAAAQISSAAGFTPYVDVTVPRPDLAKVAASTGLKNVALGFALAGPGGCDPRWGGTLAVDDADLRASVDAFRQAGGDVTVATGGAVGKYLENACGTAVELVGAYSKLLDAMGTNRLDVDIEAPVKADVVADALSQLQRSRGTAITLTLPIDLAGLPAPSLDLVQKTAAKGVQITVNGMDMNFRTGGDWGQAMVDAAQATLDQLRRVYPDGSEASQNRTLGLTVMIGRNDAGPVTTLDDAKKVLAFATSRGVGHLGIWSLGRDSGKCPKRVRTAVDCSGIAQQDLEFTKLLTGFTGPSA